jgi:opacity protein-like surface antigen
MKKLVLILGVIGIMALPGLAAADAVGAKPYGVYVGGHLGMSIENFSGRKQVDDINVPSEFSWSPGSKTDTTFGGGISVGYDFDPQFNVPVRLELDYTARTRGEAKSSRDFTEDANLYGEEMKDKVSLQTLMLNSWVDIPTGTAFTPYLGGGVGFGFIGYKGQYNVTDKTGGIDDEHVSKSKSTTNFAWSLGGGVAYDITDNWTVDLGYRYIDAGKVSMRLIDGLGEDFDKRKIKVQSHDVMLGIRFTF